MDQYRDLFLSEAREHLEGMERRVVALERSPADAALLQEIFRSAHSLKGMALSMGLEAFGRLAHRLEDLMASLRDGAAPGPEVFQALLEGVDAMQGLLEAFAEGAPGDDPGALIERVERVRASLGGAPASAGVSPPAPPERVEAGGAGGAEAAPTPAGALPLWRVRFRVSSDSQAPAARAFLACKRLAGAGTVVEAVPPLAEIRSGRGGGEVRLLLEGPPDGSGIGEILAGLSEIEAVDFAPTTREEWAGSPPEATPRTTPPRVVSSPPSPGRPRTIRVRTDLLDELLSSMGEMIVADARVRSIAQVLPDPVLAEGLDHVQRVMDRLEGLVFRLRMQALSMVTDRLPRTVRDTAQKEGKEVDFQVEGGDLEMDRAILEALEDPLLHLVRNAVDHGIETPAERTRRGKARRGTLVVSAARDRDQAVVSVRDDGHGMHPGALKARALELGLLQEDAARSLPDAEALLLVCLPGFSTARTVTETSGRGVGMDVAKVAVESLGGSLSIESEVGKGTSVHLRLPLSISILRVLLVRAGGELLGLPLHRILRAVDLAEHPLQSRGGEPVVLLGPTEAVGCLRLAHALGLPNGAPPHAAVVIEGRVRPVGLLVDQVLGQQEVFLKKVPFPLHRVEGLAGVSILGDGRAVFVLDPQRIT